jgi:hypothetical protein
MWSNPYVLIGGAPAGSVGHDDARVIADNACASRPFVSARTGSIAAWYEHGLTSASGVVLPFSRQPTDIKVPTTDSCTAANALYFDMPGRDLRAEGVLERSRANFRRNRRDSSVGGCRTTVAHTSVNDWSRHETTA